MTKRATPDHPVHELIAKRWSPYGFDSRPVSQADLQSLFEAARWAPSSYNEQPWCFLVATNDEPQRFEKLLSCLVEPNQAWARHAPVLALTVVKRNFDRNDKPNKAAEHDVGLAAGNLVFEATARGLFVHQMIGIVPEKAKKVLNIPDGFDALTALAIGYAADANALDENLRQRDSAPRQRKPLRDFVFGDAWGQVSSIVS